MAVLALASVPLLAACGSGTQQHVTGTTPSTGPMGLKQRGNAVIKCSDGTATRVPFKTDSEVRAYLEECGGTDSVSCGSSSRQPLDPKTGQPIGPPVTTPTECTGNNGGGYFNATRCADESARSRQMTLAQRRAYLAAMTPAQLRAYLAACTYSGECMRRASVRRYLAPRNVPRDALRLPYLRCPLAAQ